MAQGKRVEKEKTKGGFTRRDFVLGGGAAIATGTLSSAAPAIGAQLPGRVTDTAPSPATSYARSTGYLVYDSRLCAGCQSCMLVCSLVHEGVASTSLSRIQVSRSVLTRYPYDLQTSVCRQCPEPLCVENCPTGACHVDAANGNVRMIDSEQCIGCGTCLEACPHNPHRTIWNPAENKATKCDLCANAPYFSKKGGAAGSQACVVTCPMGALKVVSELPSQTDIGGYDVNLASPPKTPATKQP